MSVMRDGWTETTIGEVASINPKEIALAKDAPFVPMDAVKVGKRFVDYFEPRGERSGARAKSGDVLFARITPCLENGKVAQIQVGVGACGGSTEFIVVRGSEKIYSDFIYFWATLESTRDLAAGLMTGTTGRQRLSANDLGEIALNLPPLDEQKRIVDVLSTVGAYIDALQQKADAARTARNAVAEKVINSGFSTTQLSQIGRIVTGSTPSTKRPEYWEPAEVDFITPGDFGEQLLISNASRRVSREGAKASRALGTHSVLQVCIGATIGKVGHVSHEVVTNQQINSVAGLEELDAYFVALMLSTNELQVNIKDRAGTTTLPIISKSAWGELSIPWPDVQIRQGIALLAKSIDESILSTDNAISISKNLRSGLLSDLLSGNHEIPASYDSLLGAA